MCRSKNKKNILVLFGGCSTEHEVSLQSAAAVLEHMDPNQFRALPVGITKEGRWLRYLARTPRCRAAAGKKPGPASPAR